MRLHSIVAVAATILPSIVYGQEFKTGATPEDRGFFSEQLKCAIFDAGYIIPLNPVPVPLVIPVPGDAKGGSYWPLKVGPADPLTNSTNASQPAERDAALRRLFDTFLKERGASVYPANIIDCYLTSLTRLSAEQRRLTSELQTLSKEIISRQDMTEADLHSRVLDSNIEVLARIESIERRLTAMEERLQGMAFAVDRKP